MTTLELREVTDDGTPGRTLAGASDASGSVVYGGRAPDMLQAIVDGVARREAVAAEVAIGWIATGGWSNGKLMIGASE